MPLFKLSGLVTISIETTVEAETLEKAKEIAIRRHIEPKNYRDKLQNLDAWTHEEYDGEPYRIEEDINAE